MSSIHLHLYDFADLQETMERELPSHKRDVLILALPKFCKSIINRKKEVFCSQIKYYVLLCVLGSVLPIPGVSFAADIGILMKVIGDYLFGFGLDKESLEKLSSDKKISLEDIRTVLKCLCSGMPVTKDLVLSMMKSSPDARVAMAASSSIRQFKIPMAFSLPFTSINKFLNYTLNSLSDDAEKLMNFMLFDASAFSDEEQ